MRWISFIFVLFLSCVLASCANYDFSQRVVRQGNLLSASPVKQLHLGMSKEEVSILMGTSLISPTFNNDRWDYVYSYRKGNKTLQTEALSLYFKSDKLARIETR